MTNAFQDREKGFENKWAHDEEMHFKVRSEERRVGKECQ